MPATGARMRASGDISIRKDGGTASVFEVFKDTTDAPTCSINSDGTITAAGKCQANYFETSKAGAHTMLLGISGSQPVLIYNGAGDETASIESSGNFNGSSFIADSGLYGIAAYLTNTSPYADSEIKSIEIKNKAGNLTAIITADGGAVFGGEDDSDADFVFEAGTRASFYRDLYFGSSNEADANVVIKATGDIFVGDPAQGSAGTGMVLNADAGKINLYSDNSTGGMGNYFLAGYAGNAPKALAFSVDYAGNAVFTGSVSAEGNILTRADGTTLDVKDRLDKVDTALTNLKAALGSISDFAQLKTALTAALSDI
jgi:hypothetical protein